MGSLDLTGMPHWDGWLHVESWMKHAHGLGINAHGLGMHLRKL